MSDLIYPKVSVITPTRREFSAGLERVLEDMAEQDFRSFEQIVVTDGPPGSVVDICGAFESHMLVKLVVGPETNNQGRVQRDIGLAVARGEFVVFVDDSNKPAPNFLSSLVSTVDESPMGRVLMRRGKKVIGGRWRLGGVGGTQVIIRTDIARSHSWTDHKVYYCDWGFIEDCRGECIRRFGLATNWVPPLLEEVVLEVAVYKRFRLPTESKIIVGRS